MFFHGIVPVMSFARSRAMLIFRPTVARFHHYSCEPGACQGCVGRCGIRTVTDHDKWARGGPWPWPRSTGSSVYYNLGSFLAHQRLQDDEEAGR